MNDRLQISFSDIIVLIMTYLFMTGAWEWSWWYLTGIIFWYRFHVIRKRLWFEIKLAAKNGEIARKIKRERKAASAAIIALLLLSSCSKEWKCTVTTSMNGETDSAVYPFEGTKEEMHSYEVSNTHESVYFTQTTKCK